MIPSSQLLRDAAKYGQTLTVTVDIIRNNTVVAGEIPVIDGKVISDRTKATRLTSNVDLAVRPSDFKIDITSDRFRVRRGYKSLGVTESIQHGIFRVDDAEYTDDGKLSLSGSGLEAYIRDADFIQPRSAPRGASVLQQIKYLIREVLPDAVVLIEATRDRTIYAREAWHNDRWGTVKALARSVGAVVYCDYRGFFVVRNAPTLTGGVPVYTLDIGPNGVMTSRSLKTTRDRVYNAVSVSGVAADPRVPPVWGWAADLNPNSPTYFYGPFGQVPLFYSSYFFTTNKQCEVYAQQLLVDALAANEDLSGTALNLVFLEADDVVQVRRPDRDGLDKRLLQSVWFGLGIDSEIHFQTLLIKDS